MTTNLLSIHDDVIISHIIPCLFSHEINKEKSILKCRVDSRNFFGIENHRQYLNFKKLGKYYDGGYRYFFHISTSFPEYLKFSKNFLKNTFDRIYFHVCGDINLSCASQTLIRSIKFICNLRLINKNFNKLLFSENISHALNIYFLHISYPMIKLPLLHKACSFANDFEVAKIVIESAVEKHTHLNFFNFINSGTHLFDAVENSNLDIFNFLLSTTGNYAHQMILNMRDTNTILDYAVLSSNPSVDIVKTIIKMYGDKACDLISRQFRNGETIFHQFIRGCNHCMMESLDVQNNIFKNLIQAVGFKASEIYRIRDMNFQTIFDIARQRFNWKVMLDIPEIENLLLDEAYRKQHWEIVSDILQIHAKRYGRKYGLRINVKRAASCAIYVNRLEKKSSLFLLEYFRT